MAPRSAFRVVSQAVAALLLLALLVAGAGLYWLGTQHALGWLARQAVAMSEGRLELDGVRGSLYHRITVSRAAFKDDALDIEARALVLEWRPRALLKREARFTEISIADLRIATTATGAAELPRLPAALRLPLKATVSDVRVKRFEFAPGRVVQDLHLRLRVRADSHTLELVNAAAMGWRAAGTVRIDAAAPFAAAGKLDLEGRALGEPVTARVTLGGNLEALQMQALASARGASASAATVLRPFDALPLSKLTLDAGNVNLAAWDKTLPRTKIGISLEAGMPAPGRIAGTARLENEAAGPIDAQRVPLSRAAFAFTGGGPRWTISDIDLGIGTAGRVRGSGEVDGMHSRFELTLVAIDPAELHRRLQPLALSGRATITGGPDAQRVVAKLEGAGAHLELAARHAQQVVTVERGELRAEGGRVEFGGRAALAGTREFSASATFAGLDPARFIDAPPARLNGTLSVEGALAPGWRAEVRVAVTGSRLRGQPLSANAAFTASATQLFAGEARAVYAGNRLDVSGRFGAPGDQLAWSLAATNLKAIDAALAGNLKAQGTLAGTVDRPSVDFTLTARGLAAGGFAAAAVDAQGAVETGANGALRVAARITDIKARGAALDELRFDARGTRSRHEITSRLRGAGADASLSAAGGLDGDWRWSGSLAALEIQGRFPFRLTAPAQVTAGHGLLAIETLQAAAMGGNIGPASVRVAEGSITTRGTAHGITAQALLAFAPQTGFDARDLTIGGRWDVTLAETASGYAEFNREGGDVGMRGGHDLLLGLQELRLSISARANAVDAALAARSTRMGTLAAQLATRIERRDGAWVLRKDAPLDGSVTLDMRSLAWVRALAPDLDQVGGRITARLSLGGTAGRPLITGEASADEVQVRAVGPGLHLTDGTLRATFDGTNLKLSKLHLRAGDGKIEADGIADLSDGLKSADITARAERARILASPQLTVVLSGTGRAGFRDLKLAIDGKFKIDKGRYDLGLERKPKPGDDVVVIGREPGADPSAKPMPVVLDLTIDLNNSFEVHGHGLDAVLGGSIRITTRGDALHALGTIRTVRGDYLAFGQLLDIRRGELNFSGPLGNPGLDLRAGRKVQSVEVGVEVGGSLARPVVKLVSEPAMSDSERLGWLVLGRDPRTASAAELAILQAAALTTGARRTSPIQKQIAAGLGLDEFGLGRGSGDSVGVLALGKRITDRFTLRLEQSLGGTAGGLLKIDYLLSERWRLEGTAGVESAADIVFTLRFD